MKIVIRTFFRLLRAILGPFMLAWEWITAPRGMKREPDAQQRVDEACRQLAIYQFRTCPFCIKVRQAMKRLSLNIELRDARNDPVHRQALQEGGGEVKVPCLRIEEDDGRVTWMYESDRIVAWLEQRFGDVK